MPATLHELELPVCWPKHRDPNLPPFFFEDLGRNHHDCRVAGAFRTGVLSLCATPIYIQLKKGSAVHHVKNLPWCNYQTREDAIRLTRILNLLHANGEIDWEPDYPVLVGKHACQLAIRLAKNANPERLRRKLNRRMTDEDWEKIPERSRPAYY